MFLQKNKKKKRKYTDVNEQESPMEALSVINLYFYLGTAGLRF